MSVSRRPSRASRYSSGVPLDLRWMDAPRRRLHSIMRGVPIRIYHAEICAHPIFKVSRVAWKHRRFSWGGSIGPRGPALFASTSTTKTICPPEPPGPSVFASNPTDLDFLLCHSPTVAVTRKAVRGPLARPSQGGQTTRSPLCPVLEILRRRPKPSVLSQKYVD